MIPAETSRMVTKLNMTDTVQKWHYDYDHTESFKITDLIAGEIRSHTLCDTSLPPRRWSYMD